MRSLLASLGFLWRKGVDLLAILCFLVVLSGLLTGLLFPGGHSKEPARRAQANNDLQNIIASLRNYTTEYGAPPAGDHAQILKALRGENPNRTVFFEPNPARLNPQGEFLDPWGTPYRINATDPTVPWAYSFGRDKQDNGGAPGSDDVSSWR